MNLAPWVLFAPCVPDMPYAQYIASLIGMGIVVLIAGLLVVFWLTGRHIFAFVLEQKLGLLDQLDAKDKVIAAKEAEVQRGVDENKSLAVKLRNNDALLREVQAENAQLQLKISIRNTKVAPWLDEAQE